MRVSSRGPLREYSAVKLVMCFLTKLVFENVSCNVVLILFYGVDTRIQFTCLRLDHTFSTSANTVRHLCLFVLICRLGPMK